MSKVPDPSDVPVAPQLEHMYRRGYLHGMATAIKEFRCKLSSDDILVEACLSRYRHSGRRQP
jgi:hypothetical protein